MAGRITLFAAVLAAAAGVAVAAGTAGSLDTAFDSDGLAVYDLDGSDPQIWGVSHQSDGKILAVGPAYTADAQAGIFTVGRFDSDGGPDTTFGSSGYVEPFGSGYASSSFDVVQDDDGKILAVGRHGVTETTGGNGKGKGKTTTTTTVYVALVRLNSDGTLDTGFGDGGKVLTELPGSTGTAQPTGFNVLVDTDGSILVAGTCTGTTTVEGGGGNGNGKGNGKNKDSGETVTSDAIFLARYDSDGALVTSFGTDGVMVDDVSTGEDRCHAHALAVTAAGEILVGGTTADTTLNVQSGFVRRYDSDGTLDTSFGTDGHVTVASGSLVWGLPLAEDSSGNILVAGEVADTNGETDAFVARYDADGSVDTAFGTNGIFRTDLSGSEQFRAIGLSGAGILAAGSYRPGGGYSVADGFVVRLTSGGALDTTFGVDGYGDLTTPGDDGLDLAFDLSVDGNGDAVIGGGLGVSGEGLDWFLARYCGS